MQRRLSGFFRRATNPSGAKRWLGKGFWAIMDQGLFAASNFALNIMLARWLTPTDYGAFSVAYTLFLLFGTFHTALLTEPMLVFGPGKYKERFRDYLGVLLRGHWRFGVAIGLVFVLAGAILWVLESSLAPAIFVLAIASPFVLFQWLMRRACYVTLQPHFAAYAGVLYMVLMLGGLFGLYYYGVLNAVTGLGVMAFASLGSGLWLVRQLSVPRAPKKASELMRVSMRDHWNYGQWALGTAILTWVPGNAFLLLLPTWWGLEASGTYRAMLNLLLPMMNVTTALGTVLLPALVKQKAKGGFRGLTLRLTLLFMVAPVIYWLLLGSFGEPIIRLLYGGKYLEYAHLLWLAALIPVFAAAAAVSGAALRALELPNKLFIAYAWSTALTLTVGLALVYLQGVSGALLGWLLAYIVTTGVLTLLLLRNLDKDIEHRTPVPRNEGS